MRAHGVTEPMPLAFDLHPKPAASEFMTIQREAVRPVV